MTRILSLALGLMLVLGGCGLDGAPLIPPAKSSKAVEVLAE